jgi:hypothetical protein
MQIQIIRHPISKAELSKMANAWYGDFAKAVVDIAQGIMAVPAEMHVDAQQVLLEQGSSQDDLWGVNLYPDEGENFVEFNSMINIRPRQNNRSRGVENPEIRQTIKQIVASLIL